MRIATDIGGTFTDLVYVTDKGVIGTAKSNTTPPNFEEGVLNVIRESNIEIDNVEMFIHGTTVIINALTERKGAKTALITTKGFRDVLEIARGNRPDLFNINYEKPEPFVPRYLRVEVDERVNYKGDIDQKLNKQDLLSAIDYLKEENVEAIAVSFLHSYMNDSHEKEAVDIIKEEWPEVYVTCSSDIIKEWREYERTNTAVLNAYVLPSATRYIDKLENHLNNEIESSPKYVMQSNGGTTKFKQAKETPINIVESGPVAGILGASVLGKIIGEENIIAFDVGGTTAKCSLIENGEVKVSTDYYIERDDRNAGYPIKTPVIDIVEIGNGGGSIAWIDDGGSLKVGPKSAGSLPGPIAYGKGGLEPTTTDANLVTGRLSLSNFKTNISLEEVKNKLDEKVSNKFGVSSEEAALGIIRIANSNMLNALKLISVRKGHDPKDFTLIAFGGGGSMHAPALALELGVNKVVIPVASPVFSAWGMLMTDLRHDYIQTSNQIVSKIDLNQLNEEIKVIREKAYTDFELEDVKEKNVKFQLNFDMRYLGQEHTVKVPVSDSLITKENIKNVIAKFHELHKKNYTFNLEESDTEIVNIHITAFGLVEKLEIQKNIIEGSLEKSLKEKRNVYFEDEGWIETNVYDREKLPSNKIIEGPAIIEEEQSVTVIYKQQQIYKDEYGNLIITKLGDE